MAAKAHTLTAASVFRVRVRIHRSGPVRGGMLQNSVCSVGSPLSTLNPACDAFLFYVCILSIGQRISALSVLLLF